MNLLSEYCKRSKNNFVIPTNDGICFFNEHNRPAIIGTTSVLPKAKQICYKCKILESNDPFAAKTTEYEKSVIIVELFVPDKYCGYSADRHFHVSADSDVLKEISNYGYGNVEPVHLNHGRDIEIWLWNFFLFHSPIRRSADWDRFLSSQKTNTQPLKCYEQMAHCAINYPKIYEQYYNIYQSFVPGRKYLLFG